VTTEFGKDVTINFIAGAHAVSTLVKKSNVKKLFLKSRSPACGYGKIYDGSFTQKIKKGDRMTCALLKRNGIMAISDADSLQHLKFATE
jgi:uncharacterized protein YbbK (DUF523 family)